MNDATLISSEISARSERYGKQNTDIAKAIVSMINQTFNNRAIGQQELLSVYMYTFGCLEIYRTIALNGGFISASLSGVNSIPLSEGVPRIVFLEAYSSAFIEGAENRNRFEFESNMMFSALFKVALSHYLSDRSLAFLFDSLRLEGIVSTDESAAIENFASLINGMISRS
ncbi:TPA: hypothetical protein LVL12_000464 [Klebsiella oxytoca]|nr:hypothetical protein [Klebsiella oxytoca]